MPARYFQFQPEEYQSQFDAAPIQMLQSTLGQSQQRFDTAQQNIANFQENLANVPYLDQEARSEYLNRVEGSVTDIYDKYGNDLSAGLGDLTRSLGKLRQDPYLNLNRRQVEQSKLYEAARAKDPNKFIGLQDPRTQRLADVTDPTQLDARFGTRTNYTADVKENFAAVGQKVNDFIARKSQLDPQYFEKIKKKGLGALSKAEMDQILSDQDVKNFQARTSFDIDPNLKGQDAKKFLLETINSVFGSQKESQFISDKRFSGKAAKPVPRSEYLTTTAETTNAGKIFDDGNFLSKAPVGQFKDIANFSSDEPTFDDNGNLTEMDVPTKTSGFAASKIEAHNTSVQERKKILNSWRGNLGLGEDVTDKDLNTALTNAEKSLEKVGVTYERFDKKTTDALTPNVLEEFYSGARATYIHKDPNGRSGDASEFIDDMNEDERKQFDKTFKILGRDQSDSYTADGLYATARIDGKTIEMTLQEPGANQNKLEYQLKQTLYDPELRKTGASQFIPDPNTPNQFLKSILTIGKDGKYELRYLLRNPGGEQVLTQKEFKKYFD